MTQTSPQSVAAKLTGAQRHFVLMSSDLPIHPYDIDTSGLTAAAMVRRGLAFRAVCSVRSGGEQFNGYGLTASSLALRTFLLEKNRV